MDKQLLHMQKLAGLITESEYKHQLNESSLKNKIKELVHSSLGEAKKKKKKDVAPQDASVELDMDMEEPTADAGMEMPSDTMSPEVSSEIDIDPKVKSIQDSLSKALANAKALGDEKLTNQIGNTITMLVRTQIVGQQVAENINENVEPDSLVSQEARNMFYDAVAKIMNNLYEGGIKDDDIITSYLSEEGGLLGDAIEAFYHP